MYLRESEQQQKSYPRPLKSAAAGGAGTLFSSFGIFCSPVLWSAAYRFEPDLDFVYKGIVLGTVMKRRNEYV